MRTEEITSAQNPKIRNLLLLQEKAAARREQGLFVVEGRRELQHCLEAGYKLHSLFWCPELLPADALESLLPTSSNPPCHSDPSCPSDPSCHSERSEESPRCIALPAALYRKIAYRESTEGILAEVESRPHGLDSLHVGDRPLIVVLESVEKPGNLGAVLRSADAAGADAVILSDPLTDLYNPNLIRASIGAIFTVPVATAMSSQVIDWLKARDIQILTAQLQDSAPYYDVDMTRGTALVMGTESTGLTDQWRRAADAHIRIPMLGRLDSLNVSVSASILLYEAVRQRQK